jgi:hypothetical protein
MKQSLIFIKEQLCRRPKAFAALALVCVAAFTLGTAYWAGAFGRATHELELWADAQGAPQMLIRRAGDGSAVRGVPLHYPQARRDWNVEIESTGRRGAKAWGAEVWIQEIRSDEGVLGWRDATLEGDWTRKQAEDSTEGVSLVSYGEGVPRTLRATLHGSELSIRYSRHQWTGIMRVTAGGETREIDTWRNNYAPGTTTFYAPPGPDDRIENAYTDIFISPDDSGSRLLVGCDEGSLTLLRARFDGRDIPVGAAGAISLPSRFRLVWLPALGMGLVTAMALPTLLALLFIPFRRSPFWSFVAAVCLLKLWMIGGDELRASLYDGRGYMLSSIQGFWSEPFSPHGYERQPVYPLFISLCRVFGLPLRMGLELLWLGACLCAATALPRLKLPRWSAAAAFALMALNPITFPVFAFGYQDVAYAPLLLCLVGAMLHALPAGRWRAYACAGVGLSAALVWNTRPEHVMVAGLLAVFALTLLLLDFATSRKLPRAAASSLKALAPAVVLIAALTLTFAGLGRTTPMGVFAASNFQLPGFTALYNELLAIQPANPEAYHPVPTEVRMKAYEASPTFATLKWALEGPALETYTTLAAKGGEERGDYGVFFFWGLRQAPWHIRQWQSAAQLDRFYAQCAAELKAARERGAYASRAVHAQYIEPDGALWLPFFREGLWRYMRMLASAKVEQLSPEEKGVEAWIFDSAALRRTALAENNGAMWSAASPTAVRSAKKLCAVLNAVATWGAAILFLPVAVLFIFRLRGKADPETMPHMALLIIVTAAFLSRLLLVSVMHAAAFGAESRYILPVAPLPALLCVVFAATLWAAAKRTRRPDKTPE